jgi:Bacteriocin-protection, YdeI or OmpD-Associated
MDPQQEFSYEALLRLEHWGQHVVDVAAEAVAHVHALGSKRVIAVLVAPGGQVTLHGSLHPLADGRCFIQVGSKAVKQLKAEAGDLLSVRIRNDDTLYQCEFPEAMEAVLEMDPLAKEVFDRLRPGTVRSFLFWVLDVKSTDKQIERALMVADALKAGVTSPQEMIKLKSRR